MESLLLLAQTGSAGGGFAGGGFASLGIQMVLLFAVFYFFIIRPQQQRAKAHKAKIEAVQPRDEIVTAGGLIGKVVKLADDEVEVEIAAGVKVRVVRATISDVRPRGTPAND